MPSWAAAMVRAPVRRNRRRSWWTAMCLRGLRLHLDTHETKCETRYPSDEGIDDTFVLVLANPIPKSDGRVPRRARILCSASFRRWVTEGRVVPQEFDVVCLGGGVAGEAIAVGLQDSGLTLAVVERELVG